MVPRPDAERRASSPSPHTAPARNDHWLGEHPLADEHAVLLREVRTRENAIRAAVGAGRWPDDEGRGLLDYLRYEVLDQTVATERLLFPLVGQGLADPRVRELIDDHVRLRDLTDQLAAVVALDDPHRGPGVLLDLLDALDEFLDRHMHTEEAVLAATTDVGVESLRRPFRCHLWFPLTEGPEIDLDVLPSEFSYRAALERFSRLRLGERVLVRSSCDLDGLWNALSYSRPGEYGWHHLEEGPRQWRADVTRRVPE